MLLLVWNYKPPHPSVLYSEKTLLGFRYTDEKFEISIWRTGPFSITMKKHTPAKTEKYIPIRISFNMSLIGINLVVSGAPSARLRTEIYIYKWCTVPQEV